MKKIVLYTILCLPLFGKAQDKFTIIGKLSAMKEPATVYLSLVKDGRYVSVDSSQVRKGKFKLVGSVDVPQSAMLSLKKSNATNDRNNPDNLSFFLENSEIKVVGDKGLISAEVLGSVTEDDRRYLASLTMPITQKIIKIQNEYEGKKKEDLYVDGVMIESAARAADSLRSHIEAIKNLNWKFVESHPNSFYALDVFNTRVAGNKFDPSAVEPLYNLLSDELKNSDLGKSVYHKIQVAKRMSVGTRVTDFTQNDLFGNPFKLSSLRGKYVFVDFWASWCGPCRLENPHVVKAYEALKGENFEIVGVSLDQNKEAWANAVKVDNLPWIHVSDLKGWKNDVAVMFGINSVPQNFLINPHGVVVATNLRGEDLTNKLKQFIK